METFETLCAGGATFEEALEQTGLSHSPIAMVAMLTKYWNVLQMEAALNAARVYYDRILETEEHT